MTESKMSNLISSPNLAIVDKHHMSNIFDTMDIADATKADYINRLPRFLKFAEQHGIDRNLLLHYKQDLRDDLTLRVSTKNKYLTAARIALRELYRQGMLAFDLPVGVKSFQQSINHKVVGLNEDEVSKICQYLQARDNSFISTRLRVIVSLLLFQGLRHIFQSLLSELDIDKTTHGARHYFATKLIKYFKSDLTTVAKLTRHNNLEMLQVYNDDPEFKSQSFHLQLLIP